MKKLIIGLTISVFTMITVTSAFAGPHHRYYRSRHDTQLALMGLGIFTAAVVASSLYNPPVSRVIVHPAPVCVPRRQASVVMEAPPVAVQPPVKKRKRVSVNAKRLNVRVRPDRHAQVIAISFKGTTLKVHGKAPGWIYVKLPSGQFGWVMARYTRSSYPPAKG